MVQKGPPSLTGRPSPQGHHVAGVADRAGVQARRSDVEVVLHVGLQVEDARVVERVVHLRK